MATTPQNNVDALNRNQTRIQVPVTTNLTVNSGDLVYWDPVNYTATPATKAAVTTSAATPFLGMSLQSNSQLIYPNDADHVGVLVLVRGTVWLNTTAADTYTWFTAVTLGADAQTITSTGVVTTVGSTFNTIGYAIPTPATSPRPNQATPAPETVTGAAGVRIQVLLAPQHVYAAAV